MFDTISAKFQKIFKGLRSKGRLTEKEIADALREIRIALLEGDVSYQVVKSFISDLKDKAQELQLDQSLNPGQQIIRLVQQELTGLLGGAGKINWSSDGFTKFLVVGLQGTGKTTTCAKLGNYLKNKGKKVLLIAADKYRPAAAEQLRILADSKDLGFFSGKSASDDVLTIIADGIDLAKSNLFDCVIIDTAGRQQINSSLMQELQEINAIVRPNETLLVIDAMVGQEAFSVADEFNKCIDLSGLIITKTDGDARGGATLSARYVTGCPIKFVGTGEKIDQIDLFSPEQMATRILGMGDVIGLIEKIQSMPEAVSLEKRITAGKGKKKFDFNDILAQLESMSKMGSMANILEMLPKQGPFKGLKASDVDEKEIFRNKAIIQSMTLTERSDPKLLNASRKRRIAKGSGTDVPTINRLIKQLEQTQQMMAQLSGMNGKKGPNRSLFR
jgi:signal recognition particle subunit SRP54